MVKSEVLKKRKKKLGNKNEITEILFLKEDIKKRLIFAIKKEKEAFFDFLNINTIILIKSWGSIGNTLKIKHEHDIFEQILIFLLIF